MLKMAELIDGRKLRELRLKALMSQRELGDASGVSPETINRIENHAGPRKAAALTAHKLARALNVEVSELLGPAPPRG
jgi:transcriptional regulator with XRE-family HTH domain